MVKYLLRSLTISAVIVATGAIATTAWAGEPPGAESAYPPDALNEIFFGNRGPFSANRSIGGELGVMFGIGGFPEQGIMEDASTINTTYNYLLELQTRSDPTIRVPDLTNPYFTSVQFLPASTDGVISGSEFIFE